MQRPTPSKLIILQIGLDSDRIQMYAISDLETLPISSESSPMVMHTGKQLFQKEPRQGQWEWSCEACASWCCAFLIWDIVSWRISGTQLLHLRSYKTCHAWDWTLWDALLCARAADHLLRSCKWVVKYMLRQRKLWLPWSARYFIALSWWWWSKRSSIIMTMMPGLAEQTICLSVKAEPFHSIPAMKQSAVAGLVEERKVSPFCLHMDSFRTHSRSVSPSGCLIPRMLCKCNMFVNVTGLFT